MRGHCEELGMPFPPEKVIATGGGSASEAIISVVASVMNSEVYRTSQTGWKRFSLNFVPKRKEFKLFI